jgi:hypothetical protein
MSMLAVDLPPPFVYFIQRMSVFAFVEGVFSKAFFLDSFSFMKIDRFYRANYETSSFLANQVLSIIIFTIFLGAIALLEWTIRARAFNSRMANKIPAKSIEDSSRNSGKNNDKLISKQEAISIFKRVIFNVFSIIFPYVLLNSVIDITNADFKNAATVISFLLAIFVGLATFKLSLLIILLVIRNFRKINKSPDSEETTHDNLFSNLRIKYMIITHLIFWVKRWAIIIIIIISPFFDNYYTIIAGFVIFLGFFAMELDYRSTDNKLEFVYVMITYFPPLITSFMAMIMEGHYISYSSKYLSSQLMMVVVMFFYIGLIPFRMYDYYKYQPKQRRKRMAKYQVERVNTTTNPSNASVLKDRELSVSNYDEDQSNQKVEKQAQQSKINNAVKNMKGFNFASAKQAVKEGNDESWKKWEKKSFDESQINRQTNPESFLSLYNPSVKSKVEESKDSDQEDEKLDSESDEKELKKQPVRLTTPIIEEDNLPPASFIGSKIPTPKVTEGKVLKNVEF